MIKKDILKKKTYKGLELLRLILCFWVVIIHCSIIKNEHKKYLTRGFHVPTFFLLSFYFYYPIAYKRSTTKLKTRFQRLLYPYSFWSSFVFLSDNILIKYSALGKYKKKLSLKDFYLQILLGSHYYGHFWFLFNLIFISLSLTIVSFISKRNLLLILEFLGIISLYSHFSGINNNFFISFKPIFQRSLGTLNEIFPLAVFGSIFSSINLLSKIQNLTLSSHIILISLTFLLFKYDIFLFYSGFMYPMILLNILASTIFLLLFGSLNIKNATIVDKIIKNITKFTGGIYYIHILVSRKITFFMNIKRTYFYSFEIYIICYFVCFLGSKLFEKNLIKYLFV